MKFNFSCWYCETYLSGIWCIKGEPALGGRELSGFREFFDREEFNGYFLNFEYFLLVI